MSRFAVVSLALLAACAPAATRPDHGTGVPAAVVESSTSVSIRLAPDEPVPPRHVTASPDRVWEVLPAVYEALSIPAEVQDREGGVYGTRRFTRSRIGGERAESFVRCGHEGAGASAAGARRLQLTIATRIAPSPEGGSMLQTEVGGIATPVEGTSTGAVRCVSTGVLEGRILEMVTRSVGG